MSLKQLLQYEVSSENIIKFALSEIVERNNELTYTNVKSKAKEKYSNMKEKELKEEWYDYYYKKMALESMNPENVAMGSIAIIAIAISIVSIFVDKISELNLYNFIITYVIGCLGTLILLIFFLEGRIKSKSKKIVYYDIVLKTIEELLKDGQVEIKRM